MLIGFLYGGFFVIGGTIKRYNEINQAYLGGSYNEISGKIENLEINDENKEVVFTINEAEFTIIQDMPGFSWKKYQRTPLYSGDYVSIKYVYTEYEKSLYGNPIVIVYLERINS